MRLVVAGLNLQLEQRDAAAQEGGKGGGERAPKRRFYFCINNKAQRAPGANPYQMFTLMFLPIRPALLCLWFGVIQR